MVSYVLIRKPCANGTLGWGCADFAPIRGEAHLCDRHVLDLVREHRAPVQMPPGADTLVADGSRILPIDEPYYLLKSGTALAQRRQ
jgi:hypothetical protein